VAAVGEARIRRSPRSVASTTLGTFPQPNRYRCRVPLGLGRSKAAAKAAANSGRQGQGAGSQQGQAPDRELESYLAALAPEGDPETTGSGRRFGNAQVYQLRLSLIANEQLRELAAERQTSPQALATEWVMQRLQQESEQHQSRRHDAYGEY
jgi:hypothetical protein